MNKKELTNEQLIKFFENEGYKIEFVEHNNEILYTDTTLTKEINDIIFCLHLDFFTKECFIESVNDYDPQERADFKEFMNPSMFNNTKEYLRQFKIFHKELKNTVKKLNKLK